MSNQNPFIISFSEARNEEDLAKCIGTTSNLLKQVAFSENKYKFYKLHKIPKLGKKFKSWHRKDYRMPYNLDKMGNLKSDYDNKYRIVWEILDEDLKQAHKNFSRRFNDFALSKGCIHEAAYGYVKKVGILNNAQVHRGAPLLLSADISNFFPSITGETLAKAFKKLNLNTDIIQTLVGFLTIDNSLPLGFNSSPMLANIVCYELDKQINDLASRYGCKYTRYADDISISGSEGLPKKRNYRILFNKKNSLSLKVNFVLRK